MNDIRLSDIDPELFGMINEYCREHVVTIRQDGRVAGTIETIAYLPRISSDNTNQIRFSIKEEMGEKRLYCRQYDGTDLNRYSISY